MRPAGRALAAGVVIGAAAGRRHQKQQEVVLVQNTPVYTTGQTYTTTTTGPAYQQTTTTTTAYIATPTPQPVFVTSQPSKRRVPLVCCVGSIFVIAIILCLSLIPFPGSFTRALIGGSQILDYVDGNFVEIVEFVATQNAVPTLYAFSSRPSLTAFRTFSQQLSFKPSFESPSAIYFDLFSDSKVAWSWTYSPSCELEFLVIRGEGRYSAYAAGGIVSLSVGEIPVVGNSTGSYYFTDASDRYYFVFNNPSTQCFPAQSGLAVFDVTAVAFDTSSAAYTCSSGFCTDYVPYAKPRFYVLEAPLPVATDSTETYSGSFTTFGRWYAYFGLYFGLFLGGIICMVLSSCMLKKKSHDLRSDLEDHGAEAPLLRAADAGYVTTTTQQTSIPPTTYGGAYQPTPTDNPPPYAVKYDPVSGQQISQ